MINSFMQKIKAFWQRLDFPFLVTAGMALIMLCGVIFVPSLSDWVVGYLGGDEKQKIVTLVGWVIAGILAFVGSVVVDWQADAQVESADEQFRNNELVERGHVQQRFKVASEHLESKHEGARMASFYELFYLARDNINLRQNIFDILCAHLRFITTSNKYKPKENFDSDRESIEDMKQIEVSQSVEAAVTGDEKNFKGMEPTEEVISLLDILFQKTSQGERIFEEFKPNLRESFLMKITLYEANLQNAKLRNTNLWNADLQGANLRKADLQNAKLRGAKLRYAKLQGVNLRGADLQTTDLREADLRGADLQGADLQGTDLWGADLQDVDLREVKNLDTAKLSGAKIKGTIFPKDFDGLDDVDN